MAQVPNPFAAAAAGGSPQGSQTGGMDALLEAMGQVVVSNHELQRTLALQTAERESHKPNWGRMLPKPDVWRPKSREEELAGWSDFDWNLLQYTHAVDPQTASLMQEVHAKPDETLAAFSMPDDVVQQSRSLYALLSCLLRERPLQILKSVPASNGFEAYRILIKTLAPTSKSRALAIMGAVANYPPFNDGQMLEQILKFEQLHVKYQQASGQQISDELISAVLLRSLPNELRAHVTVNLPENAVYQDLRELLLRWDRSNQRWSAATLNAPTNQSEPVPMEIDQVRYGKGKDKGGKGGKYGKGH